MTGKYGYYHPWKQQQHCLVTDDDDDQRGGKKEWGKKMKKKIFLFSFQKKSKTKIEKSNQMFKDIRSEYTGTKIKLK